MELNPAQKQELDTLAGLESRDVAMTRESQANRERSAGRYHMRATTFADLLQRGSVKNPDAQALVKNVAPEAVKGGDDFAPALEPLWQYMVSHPKEVSTASEEYYYGEHAQRFGTGAAALMAWNSQKYAVQTAQQAGIRFDAMSENKYLQETFLRQMLAHKLPSGVRSRAENVLAAVREGQQADLDAKRAGTKMITAEPMFPSSGQDFDGATVARMEASKRVEAALGLHLDPLTQAAGFAVDGFVDATKALMHGAVALHDRLVKPIQETVLQGTPDEFATKLGFNPANDEIDLSPTGAGILGSMPGHVISFAAGVLTDWTSYLGWGLAKRGVQAAKAMLTPKVEGKRVMTEMGPGTQTGVAGDHVAVTLDNGDTIKVAPERAVAMEKALPGLKGAPDVDPGPARTVEEMLARWKTEYAKFGTPETTGERAARAERIRSVYDPIAGTVPHKNATSSAELLAARQIANETASRLASYAHKAFKTGDPEWTAKFEQELQAYLSFSPQVKGLVTEAKASGKVAGTEGLSNYADSTLASVTPQADTRHVMMRFASLELPEQREAFVRGAKASGGLTEFLIDKVYLNALLANPKTAVGVFAANQSYLAWNLLEHSIAGAIGGKGREVGELWGAYFTGLFDMMTVGSRNKSRLGEHFVEAFSGRFIESKVSGPQIGLSEKFAANPVSGALNFAGAALQIPRGLIIAADVLAAHTAYEMKVAQLARRYAEHSVNMVEGLSAKERVEMAAELYQMAKADPAKAEFILDGAKVKAGNEHLYRTIDEEAKDFAKYVTMSYQLTRPVGGAVEAWGRTPIGKLLTPFVNVAYKLGAASGERTPLALLAPSVYQDILAGGERARLATAKIMTGSAIAGYMVMKADDFWTGSAPSDKELKDKLTGLGWQENSIKYQQANGRTGYRSMNALDPVGAIFSFAADLKHYIAYAGKNDQLVEEATAAFTSIVTNLLSNPFFIEGLGQYAEIANGGDSTGEKVERLISDRVKAFVPFSGALKAAAMLSDDQRRIMQGYKDRILSLMPGYSKTLPADYNYWGEVTHNPHGHGPMDEDSVGARIADLISPFRYTEASNPIAAIEDDPVLREMVKQRFIPRKMGRTYEMGGESFALSPQMQSDFRKFFGTSKDSEGRTVRDAYLAMINSPAYKAKDATDSIPGPGAEPTYAGSRYDLLSQVHNEFTELAKAKLEEKYANEFNAVFEMRARRRAGENIPAISITGGR